MRHVKGETAYINPFYGAHEYTFKSPTKDRVYVKILKFVNEHPKCTRAEIQKGVWGKVVRGNCSTTFAHMLWRDLIDYDKNFCYVIRRKGKSILNKLDK